MLTHKHPKFIVNIFFWNWMPPGYADAATVRVLQQRTTSELRRRRRSAVRLCTETGARTAFSCRPRIPVSIRTTCSASTGCRVHEASASGSPLSS